MSGKVPDVPPIVLDRSGDVYTNTARIGTPVLGRDQWRTIADAQNWLLGGGSAPLAWFGPRALEPGGTTTFRAYTWPRSQNYARVWNFVVRGAGATGALATADSPGGKYFSVPATDQQIHHIVITELVSSTTPAGAAIAVDMVLSADSTTLLIMSATVSEIPARRVGALVSGSPGVSEGSCTKWHPIQDRDDGLAPAEDRYSVAGVARTAQELLYGANAFRRTKIFDWAFATGLTRSTNSYAGIHRVNPSCQTRQVRGESTRTVNWAVYASASASDGQVRVTSSVSGTNNVINIASPTPTWYTSTITVACDDLSEDGWISGGSRETLTFEHKAASGNVTTYAISVGEAGA